MSFTDFNGELMKEVVARADLLAAIDEEPRTLRELETQLPLARSTIHRTTKALIDNGVLEKSGQTFELTGFGAILVDGIVEFEATVTGAEHLEPFLNTIGPMDIEIPAHYFCDADVTQPRPHQAHVGVNRIIELIENSDSLKMVSSIISPFYVEVAHREILDGMEITVIFDERIIDTIATEYQEESLEALETGRFDVHVVDDVPFELFLFDDRMGMAAHDKNAHAQALVESTDERAVDWATELYAQYKSDAVHADFG